MLGAGLRFREVRAGWRDPAKARRGPILAKSSEHFGGDVAWRSEMFNVLDQPPRVLSTAKPTIAFALIASLSLNPCYGRRASKKQRSKKQRSNSTYMQFYGISNMLNLTEKKLTDKHLTETEKFEQTI
jgi:hypothetical protein